VNADLSVRVVFEAKTVAELATRLTAEESGLQIKPIEVLNDGTGIPLCCVHPGLGLSWPYRALNNYLDCPIIGINQVFEDSDVEPPSISATAKIYSDRLQSLYPTGPYDLLGWSYGGTVAHEMAVELQRRGHEVRRLILLDSLPTTSAESVAAANQLPEQSEVLEQVLRFIGIELPKDGIPLTYEMAELLACEAESTTNFGSRFSYFRALLEFIVDKAEAAAGHLSEHVPSIFHGDMFIFSAAQRESSSFAQCWRPYVSGNITEYSADCAHNDMMNAKALVLYGHQLKIALQA